MGRRRKQKTDQIEEKTINKRSTPANSLPVPNQLAPTGPREDWPWPELYLMQSDGGVHPTGLMFVDDKHRMVDWWSRDSKAPPTWMDPCVFTQMVFADEKCKQLLDKVVKKNSQEEGAPLRAEVERVFINSYLVYALRQFRKASPMYREWLMARYDFVESQKERKNAESTEGGVGRSDDVRRNDNPGAGKAVVGGDRRPQRR